MASEQNNDKFSIKNLLFYRAIPCYTAQGHPANYACKDCGDRFLLESSYLYHVHRKSVQITYKCRYCSRRIIFYNRCNLLSHIRSHTFKTATINVSDLKIEPLPLNFFKSLRKEQKKTVDKTILCFECKKDITGAGPAFKDRASHYMEYTNKVYSCPVCLFNLPTTCALKAHLRLHLQVPPFYCPECGILMLDKNASYPYNHCCEGFNMMRATARYPCPLEKCSSFHPNDYKKHMKEKHLKKIFSCPSCVVACYSEATMQRHLQTHENNNSALIFYQCEMCPGRLVMENHTEKHLMNHTPSSMVFLCWICSTAYKEVSDLINHHIQNHDQNDELKSCLMYLQTENTKMIYRVVKRCEECRRNFTYKCYYRDISSLPNICPFQCTPNTTSSIQDKNTTNENKIIICPLCNEKIYQKWTVIKKHFALHHKEHRCGDLSVSLPKICIKKYVKKGVKKRDKKSFSKKKKIGKDSRKVLLSSDNKTTLKPIESKETISSFICGKCQDKLETKEALETHIVTRHRDPCMAYQCMECGDCFVAKPSFSIHLSFHGIFDIDDYITRKQCFNENAQNKTSNVEEVEEKLDENQCKICRERFDDMDELEKHFRVHGMAFLKKNYLNKPAVP